MPAPEFGHGFSLRVITAHPGAFTSKSHCPPHPFHIPTTFLCGCGIAIAIRATVDRLTVCVILELFESLEARTPTRWDSGISSARWLAHSTTLRLHFTL